MNSREGARKACNIQAPSGLAPAGEKMFCSGRKLPGASGKTGIKPAQPQLAVSDSQFTISESV